MDVELALLTKILETEDLRVVIRSKVTKDFFLDEDNQEVFAYLTKVYQEHGRVPSLNLLQHEFEDFEPVDADDDILLLIDSVKEKKLYADLQRAVARVADETRGDPEEGLTTLKKMAVELASLHSKGDTLEATEGGEELLAEYYEVQKKKGVMGTPWPWDALNRATLGIHEGEFITFYGLPKSKKTWVLLYIAHWVWEKAGKSVLFLTKEMGLEQIRKRWAALASGVDYAAYRSGSLEEDELVKFHDFVDLIGEGGESSFRVSSIEETGAAALVEVQAKVDDFQSEIVFIDGLYFMADDAEWQSFSKITRGVKQLAKNSKIPMVCSSQANAVAVKGKGGYSEVAFGKSLVMDVDALFRIINDDEHEEAEELFITAPAIREAKGCSFYINARVAGDFTQKREGDDSDDSDGGGGSIL